MQLNASRSSWLKSALLFTLCAGMAQAATPFTPGSILVYRMDNGGAVLSATSNRVFVDEYSQTGTYIRSIEMPNAAPTPAAPPYNLMVSSSSVDGGMSLSMDRRYVLLAGYNAKAADAPLSGIKVVGRIDAAGNVDTSTGFSDHFIGKNHRGVASANGTALYMSGAAGEGVLYTTFNAAATGVTTTTIVAAVTTGTASTAMVNNRQLLVAGSLKGATPGPQLYLSTGSNQRVGTVGLPNALPTAPGATGAPFFESAGVQPTSAAPWGFALACLGTPGGTATDTVYVVDQVSAGNASVYKWAYNSTTGFWAVLGTLNLTTTFPIATGYGITITRPDPILNPTYVQAFVTLTTGSPAVAQIVTFQDTGGANAFTPSTPTAIVTAPQAANGIFRGICLAPSGATLVDLTTFKATSAFPGVNCTWTTATEASAIGFNVWRASSTSGTYRKVNSSLIKATGDAFKGATYSFRDGVVAPNATFFYKLEDIDLNGKGTLHDAVAVKTVVPAAPKRATRPTFRARF